MRVRDLGGGPDGWTLMLHPGPPRDPRWLDLTTTPGEPAVRIDLNPSARPPEGATVTVSAATASPGEHLLHAIAARDGCAAAAVALPELDGIRLAILGLHDCLGGTVLHMHASGPMCHVINGPDELYFWPVIWIRDRGGRWHATRTRGRSGMNDEVALRLEVVPPLSHAITWIEVLAAGQSAEALTTLPLLWE